MDTQPGPGSLGADAEPDDTFDTTSRLHLTATTNGKGAL